MNYYKKWRTTKNEISELFNREAGSGENSEDLDAINRNIERYKQQNYNIKSRIVSKCNKFFELYDLYADGLDAERKVLEK